MDIIKTLLNFCDANEKPKGFKVLPQLATLKNGALPLHYHLPYRHYHTDTDIYINRKSVGFILRVSPLVGATPEMMELLTAMFVDHLKPSMTAQWLLWASPNIKPHLAVFARERAGKHPLFSALAKARVNYLSPGNIQSLTEQGTFLLRDFQLTLSVSAPMGHSAPLVLLQQLQALRTQWRSTLKSLSIDSESMTPTVFLSQWQQILSPQSITESSSPQWDPHDVLNHQFADPNTALECQPTTLRWHNDQASWSARAFTVKQFPPEMNQWGMNESIGRLCDPTNALQMPSPFLLSLSFKLADADRSRRQAKWQWLQQDRNLRSPLAKFLPNIAELHAEWDAVRHAVMKGDRLAHVYFQAMVFAPHQQLETASRSLQDLFRANGWQLKCERYLQLPALLSTLPFMMSEGLASDLKLLGRWRTMTASHALHLAPLQGEWQGMDSPRLLLPGRRGQMAFWDPFAHSESNYNVAIAASSGRGKSAFTQEYIVAQLASGGCVWVIDVGRSYEKTCALLEGQFIAFEAESGLSLNPFTHIRHLNESLALLKPLLATMARPSGCISDEESAYLEKAIKAAWAEKANAADITTVAHWLKAQPDPTCQTLSHLLYPYTHEGMYGCYFNGTCDFSQTQSFMVLELEELKSKKDLQKIILLLLMYHISERMYLGDRKQAKTCIIDEAWDLLNEENEAAAHFIETGFRRARRYRANFVTITQSVNDYFKHKAALAAFENAYWKVILGQEAESIAQLKKQAQLALDDYSEHLLKSLRKTDDYAECLIKAGRHVSVHRIIFDPFSRILYSSKGEHFTRVKQYQAEGLSLIEAIQKVADEEYKGST